MTTNEALLLVVLVSHIICSLILFYFNYYFLKWYGRIGLLLWCILVGIGIVSSKFYNLDNLINNSLAGKITYYCGLLVSGILYVSNFYVKDAKGKLLFKKRFDIIKNFQELKPISYNQITTMEIPKSYILKVSKTGEILYCSKNFQKIFNTDESIIGKNILALNETLGHTDHSWFYETLKNHHWSDESKFIVNNEIKWLSWHNDAILDKNGNIEYIYCTGYEVTKLMQINESLEYKVLHDPLTKLLNYRGIVKKLHEQENVERAVCFFISIQNLDLIQTYYGVGIAEEVIKETSRKVQEYSNRGYLCGRIAGSGNVIIIFNPTDEEISQVVDELEKNILTDVKTNDISIHIKKNIGYAIYPEHTDDLERLLYLSHLAMIDATHNEHNEVVKYHPQLSKNLEDNISIASKLRDAINHQKIDIYFQKIININTGEVKFLEALSRWTDEELGYIPPQTFLKIAKSSNLIDDLEEYLITQAIHKFAILKRSLEFRNTILAINLSPSTFLHERFVNFIDQQVKLHQLNPSDICLELSENTFIYQLDICNYFISQYKEKGFLIAIDDFGKEYSSLSVLGSLTYDIIKIDGSFVTRIFSRKNQAIIEMIVKIANMYNHLIVAESVETAEQVEALKKLNCFIQQGYYFHEPQKII